MLENIELLCHSCIRFNFNEIIYTDPYGLEKNYNDADYIFITHSHYDHFSKEDILKVKNENTKIVITEDLYNKSIDIGFKQENILTVIPNMEYAIDNIKIKTIPAYNIEKNFHPKENNWVGYILTINNINYYIAGDTDITKENQEVKCDVAFLPVGGTYTMDYKEAIKLANIINPKIAVPIHYGKIVGTKKDAENFIENLNKDIKGIILYEEKNI